jgi:cell division protein FtsI/penicillin-binding protein 2
MVDTLNTIKEPKPKSKSRKMAIVWGIMLALLAGNVFAVWRTAQIQGEMQEMQTSYEQQIQGLDERAHDLTVRADTHEVMLRSELKQTQEAAQTAAAKATKQAERKAQLMVNKLAADYKQKRAATLDELQQLKGAAEQHGAAVFSVQHQVDGVRGDVDRNRSDLGETQAELEATRAALKSVRGDLGVQSGLIATNAEELSALRKLGDREYFQFVLSKKKQSHKIGHVALVLKKTKPNKSKFTLDVIADDRRVEKKDRTINEPVQFYVTGSRAPYELVVNEVKRGHIVGYLSVPKVLRASAR